jgi:type I restriction enzyme M protein
VAKTAERGKRGNLGEKLLFKELKPIKQVFRDTRNYLAGQFVGATRDDVLLGEVLKCLFCKLYLETSFTDTGIEIDRGAFQAAQFYRSIFAKVRSDFPEIYEPTDEILLDPASVERVMRAMYFPVLDAKSDPIGDAYEVFAGSEARGNAGQFFTPRNVTDFLVRSVGPKPGERVIDPACGAGGFLASVARFYRSIGLSDAEIAGEAVNMFGVEKDRYLMNLARVHVTLLTKGHPNIRCADSLSFTTDIGKPLNESIPVEGYDLVVTNPPFGVKIVAASKETLRDFDLGQKWDYDKIDGEWKPSSVMRMQVPPQVLFVERCISLARDGGRIGIVLPESVLSNKSYRFVVQYIRSKCTISGVMGMPESLFKTSGKGGTHTKTCLLVMEKGKPARNGRLFMAEAKWCGQDSRAREIPHDDLPEIADRFEAFQKKKKLENSRLGYVMDSKAVIDNVLCPRYYDPELDAELDSLSETHTLHKFGDLVEQGTLQITTGDEVGKLAYGTGEVPFIRTSDVSNWEIKVDPKHCIDRELFNSLKKKQDVQPGDILMVKDGTYLIGTCAIVTEYDREIVYQSHIYKIRVNKNDHGFEPFLLLALLSSPIVQRQIKAKQFTQDIIDSLGERIHELILPVPKAEKKRDYITKLVGKVIEDRIEARELARKARLEVLT